MSLRDEPRAGPPRREALGSLQVTLGAIALIAMTVIALAGLGGNASGTMVLWVVGLVLAGAWLVTRGLKNRAGRAEDVLTDAAEPVVYLRSFADETRDNSLGEIVGGAFGRPLAEDVPGWGPREQIELAKHLARLGPYVAIGRPGEPRPELGALRMWIPDEAWQDKVSNLLRRSRAVVLRAGRTPGFRWELETVIRLFAGRPQRVLVILPRVPADYAVFREWANGLFPKPLPETPTAGRLLTFRPDWTPVLLPPKGPLATVLTPFFVANGIASR